MKITRRKLRRLINEEYKRILFESQEELGLTHNFSDQELYSSAMNFARHLSQVSGGDPMNLSKNDKDTAIRFIRTLNNRIQKAVKYDQGTRGSYDYSTGAWVPGREATSDADIEWMKEQQGKLKMVRNIILQATGQTWAIPGQYDRSEGYRRAAKEYDDLPEHEKPHWTRKQRSRFGK